ncbi:MULTISPECIES: DNA topoisomerase 3 [unclassified Paenibacillus]|uniref:DNA topoisomerase III n=1 Tax=unclassified Paenibacillus TaxID=185978 RepID=UPI00247466B1|nr:MULTISPECIES: DNA topoisomerase 3 [unclassified Paenibacillus]MDH6430652.1 DNA topoisomerase-3 [Paenibacillus sp. PastH-4]MDH6446653.1 DNA topoisomerase-3 [Paenibacillus sp. PastF-4]MDH6530889.1 DNA topoisomerase-3 [Paenibacillus sp. PastH-3]
MKTLVLAEKPSVAREIARVMGCNNKQKSYIEGPKYVVTWALGHLVGLAEPEDYNKKFATWALEDLPILPEKTKLKVLRETNQQYKAVQHLMKRQDIEELIVATDAAREGELLARWIMNMAGWKKPFRRLWISSQTDKAIKEGFAKLRPGREFDRLYESARCRAEADWMIGLNVTRALTCKFGSPLSAGRVQTPTLGMIMDREQEITGFRSVDFETLTADFGDFQAAWRASNGDGRIFEKDKTASLKNKLTGRSGRIIKVQKSEKSEPHPLAYDLTELQRDANRKFGFSAKQTSSVLQRLYEQHKLVTYPRTDSRYLPSDMTGTLKERLDSVAVGPYAALARPLLRKQLPITKRIVDDSKVSDHHAIIPTEQTVLLNGLSTEERKLYDLIVRRFISLFYPPARYDAVAVTVNVEGESFHVKGTTVKDAGWREVYGGDMSSDDEEESADELAVGSVKLPELREGATVTIGRCMVRAGRTQPPKRYNEASLLTQMEKHGLGTPATRADIIEKLVSSDTIERQGNLLHPTGKGKQLIELVSTQLRTPDLTARWEAELEKIARGQGKPELFLQGIRSMAQELVTGVKTSGAEYKPHNVSNSHCPECGTRLLEKKSKRGKLLVCPADNCGYTRAGEKRLSNRRCPQCHKKMELKEGKAGMFVQCLGCGITETLDKDHKHVNKREQQKLVQQYSKQESIGSNLGELLKAALEGQKKDK